MGIKKTIKKTIKKNTDDLIYKDMYSSFYNEGVLISIQKPNRRMICYEYEDGFDFIKENFFLSFPYVVFLIKYINKKTSPWQTKNQFVPKKLEVAFATRSKLKKLYMPPMGNISYDHEVCIDLPKTKFSNIEDMTKKVIAKFWATEFNNDITDCIDEYADEEKDIGFNKWQEKTKENPKWIPTHNMLIESRYYPSFNDFCQIGENLVNSGRVLEEED